METLNKPIFVNARFLTQPITGVQRFAIEICKELQRIDRNILFVTPSNILHKEIAKLLNASIIGFNEGHVWEKIDLPIYLKSHGSPLLVNLCNTSPLFYVNQITTIHDMAVFECPNWFSKKFRILYKFSYPYIVKNSKKVITVSHFSKKEIIKYLSVNADQIEVIYNSINHFTEPFILDENTIKNNKYILCVGSVEPRKNLISVIKAFQKLTFLSYKLIIVGGKNKLFNSLNLGEIIDPANLDRIVFTGYLSDVELIQLYKNASIFLYPSLYEGFGIPPLEAMLYGCPTIVSNKASLPEVCGNASLYVDPLDIRDIASKLTTLIENKGGIREGLIQKGRIQSAKYSWEKSAQQLHAIIQRYL